MIIFEKVFQEESSTNENGTAKTEEKSLRTLHTHLVQDWRGQNAFTQVKVEQKEKCAKFLVG